MSDIIITQDNLNRFNKRLQKALKKQFNQEIPLHVSSNLFAQALGVKDEYQLKKKLEVSADKSNTIIDNNLDVYTLKAQNLLNDIKDYFSHEKSLLHSFVVYYIDGNVSLHINAKSKKFPNTEQSFGLYFEDSPIDYLDTLNNFIHSQDDFIFLENICRKYFTDDYDQNIYLGSRLIRLLGITPKQRPGQVDTYYLYQKDN